MTSLKSGWLVLHGVVVLHIPTPFQPVLEISSLSSSRWQMPSDMLNGYHQVQNLPALNSEA